MDRRVLAAVALAAMLLLAGCSSYLSDSAGEPADESLSTVSPANGAAGTPTSTAPPAGDTEPTPTDAGADGTPTDGESATATEEEWSPPPEPNKALEHKLNGSQGNRIEALEHADDGPGNATGDVTLAVTANTSMSSVDPADMGTVRGEPFFLVYVDGSLHPGGEWAGSSFYRVEGTRAVHTDQVAQRENGTFDLTVPAGAFEAAEAEGNVTMMVLLMDRDKQWDDVYGVANVTVDYELPPEAGNETAGGNETATGNESTAEGDGVTGTDEPTTPDSEEGTDEDEDELATDETPTIEAEPTATDTDSPFGE